MNADLYKLMMGWAFLPAAGTADYRFSGPARRLAVFLSRRFLRFRRPVM